MTHLHVNVAGTRLQYGNTAVIYDRSRDEIRLVNGGGRLVTTQLRPRNADPNGWQYSAAAALIRRTT